ncbi:PIN domain-containing protein [uncultured Jannaschia sp.]|nr:PIN domain-containing protein [uncultured Jannaschia sp.]
MERAERLTWAHCDPFDRIIVATALERAIPVVSKDERLDTVPDEGMQRIW